VDEISKYLSVNVRVVIRCKSLIWTRLGAKLLPPRLCFTLLSLPSNLFNVAPKVRSLLHQPHPKWTARERLGTSNNGWIQDTNGMSPWSSSALTAELVPVPASDRGCMKHRPAVLALHWPPLKWNIATSLPSLSVTSYITETAVSARIVWIPELHTEQTAETPQHC
jgi:hypothetical protein